MRKFAVFSTIALAACSDAGFEGYGPAGQGVLGSAYGYSERQVSAGIWQVQYVGVDSAEARQGAIRRANELCQQNGFGGANFTPAVAPQSDLIVASGTARCLQPGQAPPATTRTVDDRIREIDAEISALRTELVTSQAPGSVTGTSDLDILTTGINQISTSSINRRIAELQAERRSLAQQQ